MSAVGRLGLQAMVLVVGIGTSRKSASGDVVECGQVDPETGWPVADAECGQVVNRDWDCAIAYNPEGDLYKDNFFGKPTGEDPIWIGVDGDCAGQISVGAFHPDDSCGRQYRAGQVDADMDCGLPTGTGWHGDQDCGKQNYPNDFCSVAAGYGWGGCDDAE